MQKYSVEQFREYCKNKDKSNKIPCPICGKLYTFKGLWTHIDRSHNSSKQYCQGNNGRYTDKAYKDTLKEAAKRHFNNTLGEFKKFEVECNKCHKKFIVIERESKFPTKLKYFCSKFCSHSHIQTKEQNLSRHNRLYGKVKNVKNNLYKRKERHCKYCNKILDVFSKRKFCDDVCLKEYKRRNASEYKKYWIECQFKFRLKDFPDEFDFNLIKKYGWYKAKNHGNNLNGISRDHMLSIADGFKNSIDPKIISHPANCALLPHRKNSSKNTKSSITLKDLLKRIEEWDKKYGVIV